MRTRLIATMTVAILTLPLASAAHAGSGPDHKCEQASGAEHKCEKEKG